MSTILKEVNR